MKLTKKQKQKLMGRIVKVNAIYKPFWIKDNKTYKIQNIYPKIAWITGFGNIKEGIIEDNNEYRILNITNIISVIKVRFDYKAKEVNIPLDAFELTDNIELPEADYEIKNRIEMKDMYAKKSNLFPRDIKGRFIKL